MVYKVIARKNLESFSDTLIIKVDSFSEIADRLNDKYGDYDVVSLEWMYAEILTK